MNDASAYIKHLKEAFNASDDMIIDKLVSSGWNTADAARALKVYMLPDAPAAPVMHDNNQQAQSIPSKAASKGGLSSLSQAMQHILLWVFTISTTITLSIVASTMYGSGASSEVLSVYVAVALVTFSPFAFIFADYLKKYRKNRSTVTGRVWSIITIVVHSIAAIISGIILIINLIIDPTMAVILATVTIILLNLVTISTYYQATFGKPTSKVRHFAIYAFIPTITVILLGFGLYSLSRLGPIRADEQLRSRMIKTTEAVREYRANNNAKLPATIDTLNLSDTKGVTYKKKSDTSYAICGTFKTKYGYTSYDSPTQTDSYISDYTFSNSEPGEKCFTFTVYADSPTSTYR